MLFRNVLIATDLGRTSAAAVAYGFQLATEQRARVHLLHAVSNPAAQPWVVESYPLDIRQIVADTRRRASRKLASLVPVALRRTLDVRIATPLDPTADAIIEYARRHSVDLIVVGTHGRGRIPRAVLGSVADRVVRQATCPVMVVRPGRRPPRVGQKARRRR
jgi:nucleotide-binding universal stress UspA family protein